MLERCEYCKTRVHPKKLALHLKECRVYRQIRKRENNKINSQPLEYRQKLIGAFCDPEKYNLADMTDLEFKAFSENLKSLHEQKIIAEKKLEEQKLDEEKQKALSVLKEIEKKEQDIERQKRQEADRLKQAEIVSEREKNLSETKDRNQRIMEEKAAPIQVVSEIGKTEDQIINIDSLIEQVLDKNKISEEETKVIIEESKENQDNYDSLGYRELQKLFKEKYPDKSARITADELKAGLRCQL